MITQNTRSSVRACVPISLAFTVPLSSNAGIAGRLLHLDNNAKYRLLVAGGCRVENLSHPSIRTRLRIREHHFIFSCQQGSLERAPHSRLAKFEFREQPLVFVDGSLGIRQGEFGALRWLGLRFREHLGAYNSGVRNLRLSDSQSTSEICVRQMLGSERRRFKSSPRRFFDFIRPVRNARLVCS